MASDQLKTPTSWSADGRFLLYHSTDPQTSTDLWVLPMVGDRTPSVFLKTPFRETMACSRRTAGGWPTCRTNRGGWKSTCGRLSRPARRQARGRPGASGRCPRRAASIPSGGPTARTVLPQPGGRDDGGADHRHRGHARTGRAGVLFPTRIFGGGTDAQQGRQYDVAPDGRFLINTVLDDAPAPITLLQNWNPEAKK